MSEQPAPGFQDHYATLLGWLLAISFFALFININILPRTPLDQRAFLRIVHDSLGLIVIVLGIMRLIWFVRGPRPLPPPGLPDNSFAFNRTILFALVLTFVVAGVTGIFYAWGEHHREIVLFGVGIPELMADSEELRKPTGYLHSALSFYYLMLFAVWFVVGFYQNWRFKSGLLRLLPGPRV